MKPLQLSICICAIHSRHAAREALIHHLVGQRRSDEVEILIAADSGQLETGTKRNKLVASAEGAYIVHVDDDDRVSDNYVGSILQAIDDSPGVDAILIRGVRIQQGVIQSLQPVGIIGRVPPMSRPNSTVQLFDYRIGGKEAEVTQGVLWRSPGHLCPIRASIAKAVPFEPLWSCEDLRWAEKLRPHLRTAVRAGIPGEVLYHYLWDPAKQLPWMQMRE